MEEPRDKKTYNIKKTNSKTAEARPSLSVNTLN